MNGKKTTPDVFLAILPPFGPEGPPLGLACLAASLRQAGYGVTAKDYNIGLLRAHESELGHLWSADHKAAWVWASRLPQTIAAFGDAFDRIAAEIADSGAAVAGFSVHSDNRGVTIRLMRRVRSKNPAMKLIVGGLGVFGEDARNVFPPDLVDAFVLGEGERTVVELVEALLAGKDAAQVPGVALPGQPCLAARAVTKDLDEFPYPTFVDFDLKAYSTPNLPLAMSRGCVKGCTICNDRVLMGRFRSRSAAAVFAEIEHHVRELGVHDFMVVDLQITQIIEEIVQLAEMILAAGLEIRWNANAAIGEALTPERLVTLRRAGCHTLTLGVESGSDRVLRLMNKQTTGAAAANTVRAVKAAGMTCWINIVIGFPGETEDDFADTLKWLEDNADSYDELAVLNACNILDYSVLAEKPEKYGILPAADPRWHEVAWVGADGNTPAVRHDRLKRAKALCDRLKHNVRQSNLGFIDEASHLAGEDHDAVLVLCPPLLPDHPPLELAEIASYLAGHRRKALVLDLNVAEYIRAADSHKDLWEHARQDLWAQPRAYEAFCSKLDLDPARLAEQIPTAGNPVVYFHLTRGNLLATRDVMTALRAKAPDCLLVMGGEPTRIPDERQLFTEAICDAALIGEVEETLAEIIERRERGRDFAHLRGARWVDADGEPRYLPREPLRDLPKLGHPTFDEFVLERYRRPVLPVRLGRGCPLRCAFCTEQPRQGPYRARGADAVFAELCHHADTHDVTEFQFVDLIVNADLVELEKLCDAIAQSGRAFTWTAAAAPRPEMSRALFEKMRRAGCRALRFGVESFADAVLARMNKDYTGRQAIDNLCDAHAAGIETHVNLLLGFPGETDAEFMATARALRDAEPFIDFVDEINPCTVLPFSILERACGEYEVLLPAGAHHRTWSYRGYNNEAWREKRAAEMAIWVAGLDVRFHYDFFVPPNHPFRAIEGAIRERIARKLAPAAEVVLVSLPPWGFENPPVGLAYLSTYLRHHGVGTDVLDFNIGFYNAVHPIYHMLWHVENKNFWSNDQTFDVVQYSLQGQIDKAVEELVSRAPAVLGFNVVDPKERITIEVIRRFREHNQTARIILGGPACFTPEYRQIFIDRAGELIDGYCVGEGEQVLLEVVERVRAGRDLREIAGLVTRDEHGECVFTPRAPIMDLDSIPAPTYDEFDHEAYPGDSLILEWSRGCIGTCTYCKGKQISGEYRTRSADHIFAELQRHHDRHGYDNFTISDNLLNGDPATLAAVCDAIVQSGLKIRWNGECIPLPGMTREVLRKMAAAGCYELQWGLESGAMNVLKRMGKARLFTVEQAARVIRDSHEAGIKTCLFTIVGFPGETEDDFVETLAFIRENAPWIDQIKSINSMHVITGTATHLFPERFGIELPERDYHYLWRTTDGTNTPAIRNQRIRRMLALCRELNIEVRETNLTEGKQNEVAAQISDGSLSMEQRMKLLIDATTDLRSFETETTEAGDLADVPGPGAYTDRAGPLACGVELPATEADQTPAVDAAFVAANRALAGVLDGERVFAGPEVLEIDLTNFCNLDCVGCWNHSPLLGETRMTGEEKQRRLPTEMVLKLIDDAAAMGARQLQLSGAGDPLCHPDALEIIARAKARDLECTIITNGTLLTDKTCRALVDAGVDHLTVSVWAGTPDVYGAVHPNQKGKTLAKIARSLQLIHQLKREAGVFAPTVKVYNVVCHLNAGDVADMVTFAVESLAEFIEFTPIDVVPGYTDELALTDEDRAAIVKQLHDLPKRGDYLELDPTRGARSADADGEGLEFARFVKKSLLPEGFRYELDDITRFDVLCPRKGWRLDVREDNEREHALLFFYPREECENCPDNPTCRIDKERYAVKVEFLSFLGYGAFLRRIRSQGGGYDADKIDAVPCAIGWTYARVKTDGSVIPCCKADDMPLGNLFDDDFATIWRGERYAEFRRKALTTSKRDSFFDAIGCYVACDNLGQNIRTQERLAKLTDAERDALRNVE